MSASAEGGGGGSGGGGGGGNGGPRVLKLPPAPLVAPQSSSPQPQSPHSPRAERMRRGHLPLSVLINPPSMEEAADDKFGFGMRVEPHGHGGVDTVDSLTMALNELQIAASGANLQSTSSAVAAPLPPAGIKMGGFGGGGGGGGGINGDSSAGSSGSRSDDEFLCIRQAAKRSSSLKSKKTPPCTPNQVKKAVRFADAFGLDLAYVKHVLDPDNPPEIPPQAIRDLQLRDDDDGALESQLQTPAGSDASLTSDDNRARQRTLCIARPAFSQPGHSAGFNARVMAQKVVLESVAFAQPSSEIRGYVRVSNLAFDKSVILRVTYDSWRSATEVTAAYVPNSSNGMTDQFAFSLALPPQALQQPGRCATFCIAYRVCGQTYWDNNFGENYAFDSVPAGQ